MSRLDFKFLRWKLKGFFFFLESPGETAVTFIDWTDMLGCMYVHYYMWIELYSWVLLAKYIAVLLAILESITKLSLPLHRLCQLLCDWLGGGDFNILPCKKIVWKCVWIFKPIRRIFKSVFEYWNHHTWDGLSSPKIYTLNSVSLTCWGSGYVPLSSWPLFKEAGREGNRRDCREGTANCIVDPTDFSAVPPATFSASFFTERPAEKAVGRTTENANTTGLTTMNCVVPNDYGISRCDGVYWLFCLLLCRPPLWALAFFFKSTVLRRGDARMLTHTKVNPG